MNKKVGGKITAFLSDKNKKAEKEIYVFVAYDREGPRGTETMLNIEILKKEFIRSSKSRVKNIYEIVATQDLESWFFHDLEGIFEYLKVSKKDRKFKVSDVEKTNNKILAQLFRRHNKVYQKRGRKCEGFIDSLDLDKIYNNANDLKQGIKKMIEIAVS